MLSPNQNSIRNSVNSNQKRFAALKPMEIFFAVLFTSIFLFKSFAGAENLLLRQIAVFPIFCEDASSSVCENAWQAIREALTDDKRFVVASRSFLKDSKNVFQPRQPLTIRQGVLLGQLLDAHGLVTIQLSQRQLSIQITHGRDGQRIWEKSVTLHPSLPVDQQLVPLAKKMIDEWMREIPYQGYTLLDPLIGTVTYEEADQVLAKVFVGRNVKVSPGDPVQWIDSQRSTAKPLFQGGSSLEVYAEGEVLRQENEIVYTKIKRWKKPELIIERSLVRFPNWLAKQLKEKSEENRIADELSSQVTTLPLEQVSAKTQETKPLATALSAILGFAGFLLLAL